MANEPLKLSVDDLERQKKELFKPLYSGSSIRVVEISFSDEIKNILTIARRARQMMGGLEAIEALLQREEKGLAALRSIQPGQKISRITRVLFFTNDGSDRFFRAGESILKKYGNRVLGVRLDTVASEIGGQYFGIDAEVKAVLLKHKAAVEAFLQLLVPIPKAQTGKKTTATTRPLKKK